MDGGSALNVGDGHYQGSQSRNPSRAFLHLIIFRRLVTFRAGTDLPKTSSWDHLGQYNQSSAFVSSIPPGLSGE